MSLNIQSLTANKTELEWLIQDWEPLVVCLSETRVTNDMLNNEMDIKGYIKSVVFSTSRHTGGVMIYVRDGCKHRMVLQETICMNSWFLGIELYIKGHKYNILNVYHSPSASDAVFLERLDEVLEEFSSESGLLVVVGDFNIDLSKDNFYSNKLKDIITKNGLYQKVDTFTRITKNSATMIDLLITNNKELKHKVHHTPKIVDHSIIAVNMTSQEKPEAYRKTYRNFATFSELSFQLELMDSDWTTSSSDTNLLAEQFVDSVKKILDKHAPIQTKEIGKNRADKKWWTTAIGEKIADRDMLYRRAIITNSEEDWSNFKKHRNAVLQLIRKQKHIYYQEKIDNVKNNSTEMWKTLKQLMKSNDRGERRKSILFNSIVIENDDDIADNFNTYFLKSIDQIVITPSEDQILDVLNNMDKSNCRMEKFMRLSFADLKKIVNNMKNKKSSVDGITTKILKLTFEAIGDRLLYLVNNILEKGRFPSTWKTSTIIPIEKKPNTAKCEEYRPVNMVPVYEKLVELVINNQIVEYVEMNQLLTKYQAGFRKQNSCESALQSVLYKWKDALNNKQVVGVVFLDFRRAFETINRNLLLLKLKNFGMGSVVTSLLGEYLNNRTQVVKYNSSISLPKKSLHGVPQGTVMGPNLFVMYINDIVKCVDKCSIQLFADDTLLYFVGEDVCDVVDVINSELRILQEWLSNNSLSVNIEKTKFMIIKSRYNFIDTKNHRGVYIHDEKIEQVQQCKYLGVVIDSALAFSDHAVYITGKLAKKVNIVSRLRNLLSSWTKLLIYKTIVLPHLNYCATILFLLNNTEIGNMQKKQNRALRAILKCSRYTSIRRMLDETQLLSVRQTIFFNSMVVIYKIKNGLFTQHLLNELVYVGDIHNYETRSRENFYVRTVSTTYSQNNLFHKGLIEFDKLPSEIKNSQSVKLFKAKCRQYCLERIAL